MSLTDSIKFVNEDYIQQNHNIKGRLHKGHNITAATASIPSNYQTIIIDNAQRKGFMARSKRFQYDSQSNDYPGPGTYSGHATIEKQSPSFSKKGTGGFASKDRRAKWKGAGHSPGPGAYGLPSLLLKRKDFNKAATSSAFHSPIAQQRDTDKDGNPAPNLYNAHEVKTGKTNKVSADAAFKSRSKREAIRVEDHINKPAPWHYNVNDELLRERVKVPFSSFKSRTERRLQANPAPVPGPGAYHPHEPTDPVSRTVFPKKHYLCISAPAMPLPETPPPPGPGSYHMVDYDGPTKHYMSSSAFVSTTSRWTGDVTADPIVPGPAHYRPVEIGKQSFIYNAAGRWV